MAGRLDNKVAIVTGAGTGIGRGIATLFAREGAKVVVANRSEATGTETVKRIEEAGGIAVFHRTDVTQEEDCRAVVDFAVKTFGGLDVLVNNAGIFPRATLEETTVEFWEQVMATNLRGPFLLCKYSIPQMIKRGGGSIINIGSIHGLGGGGNLFAYSVSKGGLLTLTRNLARAYARYNIRVNYIIPGWVHSEGEQRVQALEGHDEQWYQEMSSRLPMGRGQTPEDAAYAALFLASDESSQVTGCILNTDGGLSVFRF